MARDIGHVMVSKRNHQKLKIASGRYNVSIKRILDTLVEMYIDEEGRMKDELKEKLGIVELTEAH